MAARFYMSTEDAYREIEAGIGMREKLVRSLSGMATEELEGMLAALDEPYRIYMDREKEPDILPEVLALALRVAKANEQLQQKLVTELKLRRANKR